MSTYYDLCINGGGPIGATLACLLAQKGLKILVLERSPFLSTPTPSIDGRAYALAEGVRPLLEEASIWKELPTTPQPIKTIHVLDNQRPSLPLSSAQSLTLTSEDAPEHLPFGWMVEAYSLLSAISKTLPRHDNLSIRSSTTGNFTFLDDHAAITLNTGEKCFAKLVIAADGRRSTLRQHANIGLTSIPYNKHALVTVLAHENSHEGSALEYFLPAGPFARLPLPGTHEYPHRSAIVWTDTPTKIQHTKTLSPQSFIAHVQRYLAHENLGSLHLIGKRWTYPLASQYAHRYISKRLLLAGDAAHGLHPVAGQGMNLGFRDVRTLVQLLSDTYNAGQDIGSEDTLRTYQRQTRPGNFAMLAGCDVMERTFSNNIPLLRHARRMGLKTLKRFPTLRQGFVRHAMGL